MKVNVIFWWIVFVLPAAYIAQMPRLQNFSVNQGLAQSTVNDFIFDKEGVLWITTGDGLDRYDSKNIVHYAHSDFQSKGLSSNSVRDLVADTLHQRLWIGSDNGLFYYDYALGQFIYPFSVDAVFTSKYTVPLGICRNELIIWVGGVGLFRAHLENFSVSVLYEDANISTVDMDGNGEWIYLHSDSREFLRIHPLDRVIQNIQAPESIASEKIHSLDISGNVPVANTSVGRYSLNFEAGITELLGDPRNVNASFNDSKGRLYIACHGEGVFMYDSRGSLMMKCTADYEHIGGSFNLRMGRSFREDRNGTIWMSTDGQGLVLINHSSERFYRFTIKKEDIDIPFTGFIRAIDSRDDVIRIGTYSEGGVVVSSGNIIRSIQPESKTSAENTVTCFYDDGINDLMGTASGLYKLKAGGELNGLMYDSKGVYFRQILNTQRFGLIAATKAGIYEINTQSSTTLQRLDLLRYHNIGRLHEDSIGNLWIGANGEGLFLLNNTGLNNIDFKGNYFNNIPPNIVFNAFHETNDFIWCATNYGLIKLEKNGKISEVISTVNGLANSCIYGLLEDSRFNLWLSTNRGISAFNMVSRRIRNFSNNDGIANMEFNNGAYAKDARGNFYFGGIEGVTYFRPDDFFNQMGRRQLYLSSFEISGVEVTNLDSLKRLKQPFILERNHGNVGFEIVVIDFESSEPHPIQYRLMGADDNFLLASKDDIIRYTDLPPGNYQLVARTLNLDNSWSESVILFSFIVDTPFWQQKGFIALCLLITFSLIYGLLFFIVNRRNRLAMLEIKRRDEIERVRIRIASDIHDEVGAGLTRISLLSEAARIDENRGKNVQEALVKLADTARDISSGLHEIIWSVNPDFDTVESLVEHARQFVFTFLEDSPLEIDFQIQILHPHQMLSPDQRRNLFLIVKEAVNNAVRHSYATKIIVVFLLERDLRFTMEIIDDGVGIVTSKNANDISNTGNGMRNMSARAEAIQFSFEVNGMARGTKISVMGFLR